MTAAHCMHNLPKFNNSCGIDAQNYHVGGFCQTFSSDGCPNVAEIHFSRFAGKFEFLNRIKSAKSIAFDYAFVCASKTSKTFLRPFFSNMTFFQNQNQNESEFQFQIIGYPMDFGTKMVTVKNLTLDFLPKNELTTWASEKMICSKNVDLHYGASGGAWIAEIAEELRIISVSGGYYSLKINGTWTRWLCGPLLNEEAERLLEDMLRVC